MSQIKKLLSIDGGGIRGIIPAMILSEIENRTGKEISNLFDIISGTSTGGIISLLLTRPSKENLPLYKAEDIVKIYKNEGKNIFNKTFLTKTSYRGMFEEKYPSDSIEDVLNRYFEESLLSEALAEVLIPSYDIEKRSTFFFKRRKALINKDNNFLMKDIARATSAAPTYFEPAKIKTETDSYPLIDGGVFANNPAMCLLADSIKYSEPETKFFMLSLGTGEYSKPFKYKKVKSWGLVDWARPILDVVLDGVSDAVDYQMNLLLPDKDEKKFYYRFQPLLDPSNNSMDDTSNKNMKDLIRLTEFFIENKNEEIENICEFLKLN